MEPMPLALPGWLPQVVYNDAEEDLPLYLHAADITNAEYEPDDTAAIPPPPATLNGSAGHSWEAATLRALLAHGYAREGERVILSAHDAGERARYVDPAPSARWEPIASQLASSPPPAGVFGGRCSPPHLVALAEAVFLCAGAPGSPTAPAPSQAICFLGESGSGKTDSLRTTLRYICSRSRRTGDGPSPLEARLLTGCSVLEALSQARSTQQPHSPRASRASTLVQLSLEQGSGTIRTASVRLFGLELSHMSAPEQLRLCSDLRRAPHTVRARYRLPPLSAVSTGDADYTEARPLPGGGAAAAAAAATAAQCDDVAAASSVGAVSDGGSDDGWLLWVRGLSALGASTEDVNGACNVLASLLHLARVSPVASDDHGYAHIAAASPSNSSGGGGSGDGAGAGDCGNDDGGGGCGGAAAVGGGDVGGAYGSDGDGSAEAILSSASLLGVDASHLAACLTSRCVPLHCADDESPSGVSMPLTVAESRAALRALIRSLYYHLVRWVQRLVHDACLRASPPLPPASAGRGARPKHETRAAPFNPCGPGVVAGSASHSNDRGVDATLSLLDLGDLDLGDLDLASRDLGGGQEETPAAALEALCRNLTWERTFAHVCHRLVAARATQGHIHIEMLPSPSTPPHAGRGPSQTAAHAASQGAAGGPLITPLRGLSARVPPTPCVLQEAISATSRVRGRGDGDLCALLAGSGSAPTPSVAVSRPTGPTASAGFGATLQASRTVGGGGGGGGGSGSASAGHARLIHGAFLINHWERACATVSTSVASAFSPGSATAANVASGGSDGSDRVGRDTIPLALGAVAYATKGLIAADRMDDLHSANELLRILRASSSAFVHGRILSDHHAIRAEPSALRDPGTSSDTTAAATVGAAAGASPSVRSRPPTTPMVAMAGRHARSASLSRGRLDQAAARQARVSRCERLRAELSDLHRQLGVAEIFAVGCVRLPLHACPNVAAASPDDAQGARDWGVRSRQLEVVAQLRRLAPLLTRPVPVVSREDAGQSPPAATAVAGGLAKGSDTEAVLPSPSPRVRVITLSELRRSHPRVAAAFARSEAAIAPCPQPSLGGAMDVVEVSPGSIAQPAGAEQSLTNQEIVVTESTEAPGGDQRPATLDTQDELQCAVGGDAGIGDGGKGGVVPDDVGDGGQRTPPRASGAEEAMRLPLMATPLSELSESIRSRLNSGVFAPLTLSMSQMARGPSLSRSHAGSFSGGFVPGDGLTLEGLQGLSSRSLITNVIDGRQVPMLCSTCPLAPPPSLPLPTATTLLHSEQDICGGLGSVPVAHPPHSPVGRCSPRSLRCAFGARVAQCGHHLHAPCSQTTSSCSCTQPIHLTPLPSQRP